MNRQHAFRAVIFALVVFGATIFGPRLGEAISSSDAVVWQLLPWVLIAASWIGLIAWLRRSRRAR